MKERPILFSAPMVRAILDGRKTVTRRIVKPMRDPDFECQLASCEIAGEVNGGTCRIRCPYGQPGDQLWVRETWSRAKLFASNELFYRADGEHQAGRQLSLSYHEREKRWRSPIHMPRWASRITLEITGVRVERLQEISEEDAIAEGVFKKVGTSPVGDVVETHDGGDLIYVSKGLARNAYHELWESINGPGSWDLNPYVWVIEFKRV